MPVNSQQSTPSTFEIRHSKFGILFLLALSLTSCLTADKEPTYRFSRFAMDTVVEYTIIAPSHEAAQAAMMAAHEEIERVERE